MDDGELGRFQVRPEHLSDASNEIVSCSDDLGRARSDVSVVLPSTAFGLLPESAELAAALECSVRRSTDHLDGAVTAASNVGSGLATSAQNYAELDAKYTNRIGRVTT